MFLRRKRHGLCGNSECFVPAMISGAAKPRACGFTLVELPVVPFDKLRPGSKRKCAAFTLVELLVVIAIIGILIALLLPAIQAAREAGRRAQCKNHLRQIAIACLTHESTHKSYPHGGWSWRWMGDPDKGVGPQQPGGWIYQTAPYLEEDALFHLGAGLPQAQKSVELKKQMAQPIPIFNCPTRRPAIALTARTPAGKYTELDTSGTEKIPYNVQIPDALAKTDYAINGGTGKVPATQDQLPPPNGSPTTVTDCNPGPFPNCGGVAQDLQIIGTTFNGISTRYTGAKIRQITDGTSKTALVGEKALPPRFHDTGYGEDETTHYAKNDGGDNSSMYQGYDTDNTRWIGAVPVQDIDIRDTSFDSVYGSSHPGGMNLAFADGSVHTIGYDIDPDAWGTYGSREDGKIAN
jgi:prepilin-type N-terminal cleavage/methylation domain-containing protein/prepilin-type processing-associated H-X9-DG protein